MGSQVLGKFATSGMPSLISYGYWTRIKTKVCIVLHVSSASLGVFFFLPNRHSCFLTICLNEWNFACWWLFRRSRRVCMCVWWLNGWCGDIKTLRYTLLQCVQHQEQNVLKRAWTFRKLERHAILVIFRFARILYEFCETTLQFFFTMLK